MLVIFDNLTGIMMHSHKTLAIDTIDGTIAVVALNRPEAANALNTDMALDIHNFFSSAARGFRVIVLTGHGRHFCAGADLKERKGMSEAQWQAQHHAFENALHAIMHCPVPVIAAVNGAAFGGGLELALACDFIYAAETARFGLTETTLGIIPGLGGTQSLPRAIGLPMAKELIFLGRAFSAAEAHHWRMVNALCKPEALMAETITRARSISANAPLAVRAAKSAMNEGIALPLHEALHCELTHYNTLLNTSDRHEGINAFNEKRKASFTGQ